ncbi:MAG: YceD family protein [Chloroflexota bacterium]
MNQTSSYLPSRVLKLNVGYLLDGSNQSSKDMELDLPPVRVAEDMTVEYVRGPLRVSRTKEGLLLQGTLAVGVTGDCYRCLTAVERPVEVRVEELYARHNGLSPDEAEFRIHEDGQLDLAPLLRAEVLIQTTRGVRCEDEEACTERMIALEEDAGIDHLDPRMAVLKDLLENDD